MAVEAKDYVKNIEKKDNLKQELRDKIDNDNFVKKLDNDVEKSFHQFMESIKSSLSKDATNEELQDRFNGWLDRQMNVLDSFKNDEIAKAVIGPTTFQLQGFQTAIDLRIFQEELAAKKDATAQTEVVSVNGSDLNIKTFKDSSGNNVDKDKIAELFNKNFKNKDILLNLLKNAKTNPQDKSSEEIKQFQRIIVGIGDYTKSDKDSDYKKPDSPLGIYGIDGKFGGMTFKAFKSYVDKNPDETKKKSDETEKNPDGTKKKSDETEKNPDGTKKNLDGTKKKSDETEKNPDGTKKNPSKAPEILDSKHNVRKLYEGKGGETIQIATDLSGYKVNIIPTMLKGDFDIQIDDNGNATYVLPNDNWEGTVSVSFTKDSGEKVGPFAITLKATETKESKPLEGLDLLIDEISKLDLRKDAYKQNLEVIPNYINKLKQEYAGILPKSTYESEKKGEQEKKGEKEKKYSDDADAKLQKIKGAMHKLLKAYKKNSLEKTLRQIKSGDIKHITTEKGDLNRDIIPEAIIYIGGKFLTKAEFLQGTNKSKKKYIDQVKWHDSDVNVPADRDNFRYDTDKSTLKNIKFSKLIISDDEFSEKGNTAGRQEIQYDMYGYAKKEDLKELKDPNGARQAIRKLIKGLDELSISNPDYAKSGVEKANLRHLREGLYTIVQLEENAGSTDTNNKMIFKVFDFISRNCVEHPKWDKKHWKESVKNEFSSISKNDIKAGHIADLGMLYNAYKNDQDGQKTGDYFKKVMGLLENYFVRGVDGVYSIEGMYKREQLGTRKDMIDSDKQRQAIRQLFKEPGMKFGEVEFNNKDDVNNFNKLKKIASRVDFQKLFEKWGIGSENPDGLNTNEKMFYDNYMIYKKYLNENNPDNLDKYGRPKLSDNTYYNAVFDFLVGIGEARTDVVKAVNSLKLYDGSISEDVLDKSGFDSEEEMKLICLLTDFNFDGRADLNDRDAIRTGVAIKTIYKDAKVDKKHGLIQKDPMQNFIEYATEYARHKSDVNYQKLQKITENIKKAKDSQEIYTNLFQELQKDKSILLFLQTVFETPIYGGVGTIFKYGGPEKASQDLPDNGNTSLDAKEDVELSATEKAIKQIMDSEKFTETFEREYQKLVEQGLEDTPATKAKFKPLIAAGVLGNFMEGDDGTQFDNHNAGLSLGGTRETKAGDFTLMMGVGATIDGGVDLNSVGLAISRGKSWPVDKKGNTHIHTRAGAGATTDVGNRSNVSVLAATGFDISTCVNKKRLANTLKARPEAYFHIGGSVGAGYSIKENSWGLQVEGHMGWSIEEQQGIEDQCNLIKKDLEGKNGLIMSMLSDQHMWEGTEYEKKGVIRKKLNEKYFPAELTDAQNQLLNHATDSIYGWLAHYMVGISAKDINDSTKLRIANDLAEVYSTARRNEALSDLNGKTHLTGMQFSVVYVIGMIFPIVTIGVDITKYKGLYTTETKASRARYQQELQTGARAEARRGKDFYDESDPENIRLKCVKNEKGERHYPALDYINDKLQVANQSVTLPKITATIEENNGDNGNDGDRIEVQGYTPEKVTVTIPKDLYKYINVNIKSKLENSVQKNADGDLLVPGNTIYHLLTSDKVNTGKFNLIIGGTTAESTDILLTPDETLYGVPTEYAGEKSEYTLDTKVLNDELTNIVKKSENPKDTDYNKWKDFPIEKCTGTINKNGEIFALLQLRDGVNPQNVEDMGLSNSKVEVKNGMIYTPQTGTLTVYKDMEGKYHLYYTSRPNYNLKVNYEQEGLKETATTNESESETKKYSKEFGLENDIFKVQNLETHFQGIEQILSTVENNQREKYIAFMKNACDIISDNTVNQNDYNNAFNTLLKMLDHNDFKNLPKLKDIRDFLKGANVTDQQKVMIVDRFKTLFSYIPQLTRGNNRYSSISSEVSRRGAKYKELTGYTNEAYPLSEDYRAQVLDKLKNNNNIERKPIMNLFGMTAFYRKWIKGTDAYGYSMTQMGHTNVLGGENAMIDISDSEKEKAKDWFTKNLEKSDVHTEILLDMLNNYVNELLSDAGISHSGNLIDKTNLFDLLKGKPIEKITEKSIDNGQENDIIKLSGDLRYVFYLLGECANESVGVQLNGLKIETKTAKITTDISSVSNNSTVDMKVTLKRTGGMSVSTSDHEATVQTNIAKESHFRVAMGAGANKGTGPQTEGGVDEGHGQTEAGVDNHGHQFGDTDGNVNGNENGNNNGVVNYGKRPRGADTRGSGSTTVNSRNGQDWNPNAVHGAANYGEGYITNNRGKRKK